MNPVQQSNLAAMRSQESKRDEQRHADNVRADRQRSENNARARQQSRTPQDMARQQPLSPNNNKTARPQPGGTLANEAGDRPRRSREKDRDRAASGNDGATAKRSVSPTDRRDQDSFMFSELLSSERTPLMGSGGANMGWSSGPSVQQQESSGASASSMALWKPLENALLEQIGKAPPGGPLSMTLLLPKLGEVDARIGPLTGGNGWDIRLGMNQRALAMIASHQERCRESLRRRMECPVRLRFERREGRA